MFTSLDENVDEQDKITFGDNSKGKVQGLGKVVFKGFRYNNLYLVDFTSKDANLRTCLFTKASLGWLWHRKLAHVGMSTLKKVLKKDMVRGLKDVVFEKEKPCSACQAGKQVANTHPTKAFMSTSRPLELLHMDSSTSTLCSPKRTFPTCGATIQSDRRRA
jgi:hypothetical protein